MEFDGQEFYKGHSSLGEYYLRKGSEDGLNSAFVSRDTRRGTVGTRGSYLDSIRGLTSQAQMFGQ